MKLQKRLTISFFFAFAVFSLSIFFNFVPCQTAPSVPNPNYSWTFCTLNPDSVLDLTTERIYLGYTSSLTKTYVVEFLGSFLVSMLILDFISRKNEV